MSVCSLGKMEQIVCWHHCNFPYTTIINVQFDTAEFEQTRFGKNNNNNNRFLLSRIKEKPLLS